MRPNLMTLLATAALTLILPASLAATPVAARTELISIVGVPLTDNQYIRQFTIYAPGAHVLAVCHVPNGWHVSGKGGEMKGRGGLGVSWVNTQDFDELQDMFLVRATGNHPAAYKATVSIGRYGGDYPLKLRALTETQLKHIPADGCPPDRG